MQRQLGQKKHFTMTLYVILFAAKLIRCLGRFRKRKQLIQEWIDLQASNIASIVFITQKINSFKLPPSKIEAVLHGLPLIENQSRKTTQQLYAILTEKGMQFGKRIVDICVSFEAYGQFLLKQVQRQVIIKQIEEKEEVRGECDKTNLQQTTQKIVFRTYQLSLLIGKYLKCLRKGKDLPFFRNAMVILANLNKKHDHLLKQQQKNKERERIQHIMGKKVDSNFIYSQKCLWHLGPSTLYVFQTLVALQCAGTLHCIELDKYCSVFSKQFDNLHMGCLVSKNHTLHIIFSFGRQLGKFLRVLNNLINFEEMASLAVTQTVAIFAPFMVAQVVDFRPATDLRGNKREQFTIIFSAIREEDSVDADQMRNSMRQSGINWTDINFSAQPQQIHETITLTAHGLEKVKELCEKQYRIRRQLPKLMNYGGQASKQLLMMLQWQSFLNFLLRSKTIINNPILLLKNLHVTDVFLESSLSRTALLTKSRQYHCKLCACLDASSMQQFFRRKLRYLARKYGGYEKEYCYYLLVKIRDEMSKVSVYELNNCMQLIAWHYLRNGKIDYSFRKKAVQQKKYFVQVLLLGVDQRSFEVQINGHSLVNDVIDQICLLANVPALFGFRLTIYFQDRELLLRPNELILPLVNHYNIKCQKSYSSTIYSKFKSFGRLIQFSQNGLMVLKQVIFYPLSSEQTVLKQWLQQFEAYQFKCQKLIGLSRECKLELIVLLGVRQLMKEKNHKIYQKFVPTSLEEELQDYKNHMQKIYNLRRECTLSQISKMIQSKMSLSPFFRSYSWEMRICELSQSLFAHYKKVKSVFLGINWSGICILTLNQKLIMRCEWQDCSISLGTIGIKISNQTDSITLKGLQLYQTYSLCKQYKALTDHAQAIKNID